MMRIIVAAMILLVGIPNYAVRLRQNPIITPESSQTIGTNINGPSLIQIPTWVKRPLGRYYLYFAHHGGKFIRLAYADHLSGPWRIHKPGTLLLEQAKSCYDHIASPDVHVDQSRKQIVMYFHCPSGSAGGTDIVQQKTFFATSSDGLHFTADTQPLGPSYFRVFQWRGYHYAVARAGVFFRSRDGRSPFEQGPALFSDPPRILRHPAVDVRGDTLRVYYSRIGDRPERILRADIPLSNDWMAWRESEPVTVLSPERDYEGGDLPLETSKPDAAPGRVRQLRDPGIYREGGRTYLLYSIAGESGIAIAELRTR